MGIGPAGKRQQSAHLPDGPKSVHTFGTDEALAFARATGSRLLITVNAGTGTADEAAAWVRYVNDRQGASDQANRVEYWEVGNELYGKGGAADQVTLPPDRYAERFLKFAEAMRAADSNIRIGAIGGENFGLYRMNGYPDWNRVVLSRAADRMDFLAVHNAYAPMVFVDRGDDVRTVYAAMLAAPVLIAENLATLSKQIDEFAPRRASAIRIAVTEWGPWFQADPKGRFLDHVKTLGSALFVASTLKTFIESPRTDIANAFKLVDNAYLGWIGPRRGHYVPKAPYYALQMYTHHFGSILVHTRTESPINESAPVGLVAAVPRVPYLDVLSGLSEDGKTLYLMAVNKHLDTPITAAIRIQGFAPGTQARSWTLNGSGIDAHTGTELPTIPGLNWGRQAADQPRGQFHAGGSGEVAITTGTVGEIAETFQYTFPAHSVTAIEIRRNEGKDAGS
jgi:alpha-N-arabinofuranosidase